MLNIFSGLSSFAGAILAFFFMSTLTNATPYIMSISAASFIYVSISDLIPHLQEHTNPKERIIQTLLILAGISVIYFMSHTHQIAYEKNDLPFNFGVYTIELLIDNEIIYSIQFDKYNFTENPLIYTEIDYHLLQNGIKAHRLFNKKNHELSFVKLDKSDSLILNNRYNNFQINIKEKP